MTFARHMFLVAAGVALMLYSTGCDSRRREDQNPAPSSSLTKQDAIGTGAWWALFAEGRSYSEVSPTGSMAPVLDSRSVLLLEAVTAADLRVNDIALWERTPGQPAVCHRVMEVRPDGVLFSGDNNRGSDGWVSPDRIRWRVAGILYTRR